MEKIFYPFRFDAYKTKIQSQLTIYKLTLKQKYNDEDYRMAMLFILRKWHFYEYKGLQIVFIPLDLFKIIWMITKNIPYKFL